MVKVTEVWVPIPVVALLSLSKILEWVPARVEVDIVYEITHWSTTAAQGCKLPRELKMQGCILHRELRKKKECYWPNKNG